MTKKNKKIIIMISVLFIAIYALSSYHIIGFVEKEELTNYNSTSRLIDESIRNFDYSKTSDELICCLSRSYYQLDNMAWGVALYDKDAEVVAKTGSFIDIYYLETGKNEFILIDNYLTSEIKKQISDYIKSFKSKTTYVYLHELNFVETGEEKIPVSFIISGPQTYEPLKVTLSDEKDFKTLKNNSDEVNLEIGFTDIDEKSYIHKEFNEVNDYFENSDKDEIKRVFLSHSGGGTDSAEGKKYFGFQQFADGGYVVVVRAIFDYRMETLKSKTFQNVMINQTICFVIFYSIALISLLKYFRKNKALENAKAAFTSAAAHELKTPLAVIENQCECIMENVAPEKNGEYINSIYSEALRMNKLVSSLLQYNRLAAADKIETEMCCLDEIVYTETEKYLSYFNTKNIRLETDICKNSKVQCNAELIALVIDNFLSNAVRNTENGNKIKISLTKNYQFYRFSVYNEGKNIPDEELINIWNLLNKTDKSRNRDDNSTGMGLSICSEILKHHKYSYGALNNRDGVEFYFITK